MSVVVEMTGDEAKLWNSLQKVAKQTEKVEKAGEKAGRKFRKAGKETDKAFGGVALSKLVSYGAGLVSVSGTAALITKNYQAQVTAAKELTDEVRKASNELVAFAALQEGGTKAKRVQQAVNLAAQYGITDRGEAFNTVQALQSALGGNFKKGLEAAETVFAATQVGITLPKAREVAALGISQGQGGAEALRRAFVAGEESSRTPETIASGARGLGFFTDPATGFAAAGQLAGGVGESELVTYVQAAGEALSATSALDKVYKKLGVTAGTELEKLAALKEAGIITVEDLAVAGVGEKRQRRALSILIPNVENVERIREAIERKAVPGIFPSKRFAIETELPQTRVAREIDVLETMAKDLQAFGPGSEKAAEQEREFRKRGVALRRLGKETAFGFDVIDEQGRATKVDEFLVVLDNMLRVLATLGSSNQQGFIERRIHQEMDNITGELKKIAKDMERAANQMDTNGTATDQPEEILSRVRSGEAVSP